MHSVQRGGVCIHHCLTTAGKMFSTEGEINDFWIIYCYQQRRKRSCSYTMVLSKPVITREKITFQRGAARTSQREP